MGNVSSNCFEVVVIGGGMAGSAAAVASARLGCSTLLIEQFAFLGGWSTAALVNPFMSHCTSDGKPLVAGIFQEIRDRLASLDAILDYSFDPEAMKYVLQEMLLEAGVELRLHTFFENAQIFENAIQLRTRSKSGAEEWICKRIVDCSGDGDVAVALGADFETGDANGLQQAVTLMFDMGGVDLVRAMEYVRDHPDQMRFPKLPYDVDVKILVQKTVSVAGYYDLVAKARSNGEYHAPGDLIFYISRPTYGIVTFNTTHVGHVDGTNASDLTRAEIEGRRQMFSIAAFVKKYVPGFENSYLLQSAAHIGVRETRRIVGEYVFSEEDVVEGRKFYDGICRLAYPVDIHSGEGYGYTRKEEELQRSAKFRNAPPPGDWYEIPYRCLVPLKVEDVLVAGRCVSSTHAGHGAIRIMPSCVAMGQAAGTAAALSLKFQTNPRCLDTGILIDELRRQGALV